MIYMFCYDIRDPKRLRRVSKKLEGFGIRVQYSFFQCDISRETKEKLKKELLEELSLDEDSLFIYPLCYHCIRNAINTGSNEIIELKNFEII